MNNNLTDITVVLDRSGSMASCRADAEGGLNTFVETQSQQPGDALFTLVEFDDQYNFVHKGVPIKKVPPYNLVPRGRTALLDAIGRAINETGQRLGKMPESDRPGLVVFAILTDGGENASTEFNGAQVRAMIEDQTKEQNWQFTYLGANQDAFAVAGAMGIKAESTMNYSTAKSEQTFRSLSANTTRMRATKSLGGKVVSEYTEDERNSSA